ncbi:hypothetical protein I5G20_14540 [Pseudomonas aeruginosa]|nr:hypothetical protein [Pseudomonas aeruginosa]
MKYVFSLIITMVAMSVNARPVTVSSCYVLHSLAKNMVQFYTNGGEPLEMYAILQDELSIAIDKNQSDKALAINIALDNVDVIYQNLTDPALKLLAKSEGSDLGEMLTEKLSNGCFNIVGEELYDN